MPELRTHKIGPLEINYRYSPAETGDEIERGKSLGQKPFPATAEVISVHCGDKDVTMAVEEIFGDDWSALEKKLAEG